jgi:NTP pyrophosphatase (non-canonical NTP hydrolase)
MASFTDRSLEAIRADAEAFALEREWTPFHTPRNLLLALVSEVGEAAEVLRWQGDADPAIPERQREHWGEELADIFILLVRLADRSGVDLTAAFAAKLAKARLSYPVERFEGSSRKYDDPDPDPVQHARQP